jgi:hypothetical protein
VNGFTDLPDSIKFVVKILKRRQKPAVQLIRTKEDRSVPSFLATNNIVTSPTVDVA